MTDIPSWDECRAQGMTCREAAAARGVHYTTAWRYAQANGFVWPEGHSKAKTEELRKYYSELQKARYYNEPGVAERLQAGRRDYMNRVEKALRKYDSGR